MHQLQTCFFATAIVVACLGATRSVAQAQGSIAGRVTEAGTHTGVADARVQATLDGRTAASALTDQTGAFELAALSPGSYTISINRLGFEPRSVEGLEVGFTQVTTDIEIEMLPMQLQQVVTSASRAPEKLLDAPATVSVVSRREIEERPAETVTDQIIALPGVDAARGGLLQANVVTRGFNNIFSGALLTLTDNRFASIPSLRANVSYLIPTTSEDIERIEVVLGPGAALYGPNAAGGILNIVTRSPFASQGSTIALDGGGRSIFRGAARSAGTLGERFGYKVSYDYFRGDDWRPIAPDTLERKPRDFALARHGGEARLDFRPSAGSEIIANAGQAVALSAVEPTGLGPAQVKDWTYRTYQLRSRWHRVFAQVFLNTSDAGDTYLLRTLEPIVDRSTQLAAEFQEGLELGRESLVYGMDYVRTTPRTGGTITGRNEGNDEITETGGYAHSVTRLAEKLDLVAAARLDSHSRLDERIFSPRLALVFKPAAGQNFRVTYNRAFSTPTTNNLFLDLAAGRIPAGGTELFGVRALGVPAAGLQFRRDCPAGTEGLCMRVPLAFGGNTAFVPASAAPMYRAAISAAAPALLAEGVPAAIVGRLATLQPTQADVATQLRTLNNTDGSFLDVSPSDVRDVPALRPEINDSYEVGYKALLFSRVSLSIDAWHDRRRNLIGPAVVETPNVFLERSSLERYLVQQLAPQVGAQQAAVLGARVAAALAGAPGSSANPGIPLGVVNFDSPLTAAPDVIATYRNSGALTVWGSDLSTDVAVSERFSVAGTYSYVNRNLFPRSEVGGVQDISLNAPRTKGSLAVRFHDEASGTSSELRTRRIAAFPVDSYISGTVGGYTVTDAQLSFRPAVLEGWMLSLRADNVFNRKHVEFVGGGVLGRLIVTRLQKSF